MTSTPSTSTTDAPDSGSRSTAITIVYGDGIGPEIMRVSLRVLRAAGVRLDAETIETGEAAYRRGERSGIERSDHWRCRFQNGSAMSHADILALLERVTDLQLDFIKTENLCTFDGEPGYSLGQGQ